MPNFSAKVQTRSLSNGIYFFTVNEIQSSSGEINNASFVGFGPGPVAGQITGGGNTASVILDVTTASNLDPGEHVTINWTPVTGTGIMANITVTITA